MRGTRRAARDRLAQVSAARHHRRGPGSNWPPRLGIDSLRAPLLALRAARAVPRCRAQRSRMPTDVRSPRNWSSRLARPSRLPAEDEPEDTPPPEPETPDRSAETATDPDEQPVHTGRRHAGRRPGHAAARPAGAAGRRPRPRRARHRRRRSGRASGQPARPPPALAPRPSRTGARGSTWWRPCAPPRPGSRCAAR